MSAIPSTSIEPRPTSIIPDTELASVSPSNIYQDLPGETIIYRDIHLLLSDQHLVLPTKTYQLAAINAVHIRKLPIRRWPMITLAVIGGMLSLWLLTYSLLIGAAAVVVLGLCVLSLIVAIKPNYVLRIRTAESEMDALMSIDHAYIQRVHDAITELLTVSESEHPV